MHSWAVTLRTRFGEAEPGSRVSDLRIEPSLVTGVVDDEQVSFSAEPIPARIWAVVNVDSRLLAQELEHTWEQPLIPKEIATAGSPEHVAALVEAFADAVDEDPSLLLRWRGLVDDARVADGDPWRGGELPALPAPARRPPESVPKRFGASGIRIGDEDLVEVLVRAYAALHTP